MALFSIWEGDKGGTTLKRGGESPRFADGTLDDPDAVKVMEFRAASWIEACQALYDLRGWGDYVPPDPPGREEIGPDEP